MVSRNEAYIVSACRSAIGVLHGGLGSLTATQLGAHAVREAVKRSGVNPAEIDEVIMGQVVQGGAGQAPARQAAIHGGIPAEVPAMTINKVCGSGLKAVMENQVNARAKGKVKAVNFTAGDQVDTERPIIELELSE